jgi:hypothetical protein
VRPKIVALETDKSIPHIQSRRVIIIAGVNDCLGRDILSVRQMALRAAVLYLSTPLREQRGPVMPVTEDTPRQLVLKSGSTTLTLDKDAGKATLQRKLLIWRLKPIEAPLSDVSDVTVDTAVDRASGVEVCHTMLVRRTGEAWALPAADKKDAEINASAIRDFLSRQI